MNDTCMLVKHVLFVCNVHLFTAQDFPPIANAGNDVEIQLPLNKVALSGEKSTDDRAIVAYQWEVISGDPIDLVDDDTATPTATGLAAGSYSLRLTVFDELGQFDDDEVNINVKGHYLIFGHELRDISVMYFRGQYFKMMLYIIILPNRGVRAKTCKKCI